jgi:hypothetical protein
MLVGRPRLHGQADGCPVLFNPVSGGSTPKERSMNDAQLILSTLADAVAESEKQRKADQRTLPATSIAAVVLRAALSEYAHGRRLMHAATEALAAIANEGSPSSAI